MDINILKNIVLLFIIIFLFLLISNDEQYNKYIKKDKINYLILLLLIYFIYIEIPLSIIIIFLLIILILNKNFYNTYLKNNRYLKDYLPNIENFNNTNEDNFDFKPYEKKDKVEQELVNDVKEENENIDNNKNFQEPFKTKVQEIKKHLNNAINIK